MENSKLDQTTSCEGQDNPIGYNVYQSTLLSLNRNPCASEYDPERTPSYEAFKAQMINASKNPKDSEYDPERTPSYEQFKANFHQLNDAKTLTFSQDGVPSTPLEIQEEVQEEDFNMILHTEESLGDSLLDSDKLADSNLLKELFLPKKKILSMLMNENAKELLMGTFGSFKNVGEGQRTQAGLILAISDAETAYNAHGFKLNKVATIHLGSCVKESVKFNNLSDESDGYFFRTLQRWRNLMLKNTKEPTGLASIRKVVAKVRDLKSEKHKLSSHADHKLVVKRAMDNARYDLPTGRQKIFLRTMAKEAFDTRVRENAQRDLKALDLSIDLHLKTKCETENRSLRIEQNQLKRQIANSLVDIKETSQKKKAAIQELLKKESKKNYLKPRGAAICKNSLRSATQVVMGNVHYDEEIFPQSSQDNPARETATRFQQIIRSINPDELGNGTPSEDLSFRVSTYFEKLEKKSESPGIRKPAKRKHDEAEEFNFGFPKK